MKLRNLYGCLLVGGLCSSSFATILTFDISGISNHQSINQGYGDAVTATTMGGFGYGVGAEGFTPDVQATYGTQQPALWTTGYGNLTNILFEDQDGSGILTVTLTAAAGFNVALYGFDLSAYGAVFTSDPTVQRIEVTDGDSNSLYLLSNSTVSETTRTSLDFSLNPLIANSLTIAIDARNLGGLNDDIAIDNIRFGQQPVPEPATLATVALGLAAIARKRRAKK